MSGLDSTDIRLDGPSAADRPMRGEESYFRTARSIRTPPRAGPGAPEHKQC